MGYGYTVIQVVCWVELPEQRRICSIFVKIWISINGTQRCGIGSLEIHRNSVGCWVVNGTPEFWGVTDWFQGIGKQLPRELGYGYPQVWS